MSTETFRWRRLDLPGTETARWTPRPDGGRLAGRAEFEHAGSPARLEYAIELDPSGRTLAARVAGTADGRGVSHAIERAPDGRWSLDGRERPEVGGADDVDLAFTPATNALPIRRLALEVGASAAVRAAWLRFPELDLVPLDQTYRRVGARRYAYASATGFRAEIEVDEQGFVVRYPGLWERESPP